MVQPSNPPAGDSGSGHDPWDPPGSDEPTQQLGPPGGPRREPTRPLPQPGEYGPPSGWGAPGPYAPPPQYGPPGQYAPPSSYPPAQYPAGQYQPPGQYGPPTPYGPPAQYGPPDPYGRPGPYGPPGQFPAPGGYAPADLSAQPVHWQPWGAPGPPREPGQGSRKTVIALVVGGLVVLVAVVVLVVLGTGTDGIAGGGQASGDGGLPSPTLRPDGLGEDPFLDGLAQSCYDGDMSDCDRLYDRSDAGSDYETYGDTCAGRQPIGTFVYCTETFSDD